METMLDRSYRVVGAVVNNTGLGNANAVALYQVSNSALQIGTKSFKIRKLFIHDDSVGTQVHIGIGVAGAVVDVMPTFQTVATMDNEWQEWDIPDYEFFGDAMVWPVAGAAGTLHYQATVEEIG